MRTCYIERLNCERKVPYDADDHSALQREGRFENEVVEVQKGLLKLRIKFDYKIKAGDKEWGGVEGSALITVKDDSIEPTPDGKAAKVGDTIGLVIDGAMVDEVFLAVSHVLRSMHLPGMLFAPQPDQNGGPKSKKS